MTTAANFICVCFHVSKKISMTCGPEDCRHVERLLTGLTALEDVHIGVFDLRDREAGPHFTEGLLHLIISAPRHYFEWRWHYTCARQAEIAEQHDVMKTCAAKVIKNAKLQTTPHLLFRRGLLATGYTHMSMRYILARGHNLSPYLWWERCV